MLKDTKLVTWAFQLWCNADVASIPTFGFDLAKGLPAFALGCDASPLLGFCC